MADRDQKISIYVTKERKHEIERRAEEEDMTVSSWLNRVVGRQLIMEAENTVSSQTRAAEQLQQLIDRGTRQLRDATQDLRDMQAKQGVYAIACFEFLKQQQAEAAIDDALSTGARRLRDDVDPLDADVSDNGDKNTTSGLDIDELRND